MEINSIQTETLTPYSVDLPDFQGPLDLLLNLIEQGELDITKISLAYGTDRYLAYLDILREIDPDEFNFSQAKLCTNGNGWINN